MSEEIEVKRRNYRAFAYLMKAQPKYFRGYWKNGVFRAEEKVKWRYFGESCWKWELLFKIGGE